MKLDSEDVKPEQIFNEGLKRYRRILSLSGKSILADLDMPSVKQATNVLNRNRVFLLDFENAGKRAIVNPDRSAHPLSKLTNGEELTIRAMRESGKFTLAEIADEFEVSIYTVQTVLGYHRRGESPRFNNLPRYEAEKLQIFYTYFLAAKDRKDQQERYWPLIKQLKVGRNTFDQWADSIAKSVGTELEAAKIWPLELYFGHSSDVSELLHTELYDPRDRYDKVRRG